MRRAGLVVLAFLLLLTSCVFKKSDGGGNTDELTAISSRVKETTYAAVYRYTITGSLAPAVRTKMEIVQQPPLSLRRLDTTTQPKEGKPVTLSSWLVQTRKGSFGCSNEFGGSAVQCQPDTIVHTTFATQTLDPFFDAPQDPATFSSVRKTGGTIRIHGERAMCFEAAPVAATEPPVSTGQPQITPEHFRFELCYSSDGILVRGRRTSLDEAGVGDAVVEIVSLSRVVEPGELKLPGPVGTAGDVAR